MKVFEGVMKREERGTYGLAIFRAKQDTSALEQS